MYTGVSKMHSELGRKRKQKGRARGVLEVGGGKMAELPVVPRRRKGSPDRQVDDMVRQPGTEYKTVSDGTVLVGDPRNNSRGAK